MTSNERTVGRQDLSAFGKRRELSFRPANVPTPEPTTTPPAAPDPAPGPAPATTKTPARRTSTKRAKTTRTQADAPAPPARASSSGAAKANRSVHILSELRSKLRKEAEATGVTQTHIVLTAIEAHYDELEATIAAARADELPAKGSQRLFEVDHRQYRRDHQDRQPITLRLTPRNEEVLDQVQDQVNARNRSDLVEAALILAFGTK